MVDAIVSIEAFRKAKCHICCTSSLGLASSKLCVKTWYKVGRLLDLSMIPASLIFWGVWKINMSVL